MMFRVEKVAPFVLKNKKKRGCTPPMEVAILIWPILAGKRKMKKWATKKPINIPTK